MPDRRGSADPTKLRDVAFWLEARLSALPVVDPDREATALTREEAAMALGEEMANRWPSGIRATWEEGRFALRLLGVPARGRHFESACAAWAEAARAAAGEDADA